MKKCKNTCFKVASGFFEAASGFFEANREVPAFFFQNCRKLLYVKTLTPRAKVVGRKPDSPSSKKVRIPEGHPVGAGGGQA